HRVALQSTHPAGGRASVRALRRGLRIVWDTEPVVRLAGSKNQLADSRARSDGAGNRGAGWHPEVFGVRQPKSDVRKVGHNSFYESIFPFYSSFLPLC